MTCCISASTAAVEINDLLHCCAVSPHFVLAGYHYLTVTDL